MVDAPSNEMPRRIKLNYFRSKVQALREQADYLTSQCAPQNQSSPIFLRKIIFQATISGAALHIMQQFSFWSSERNSRPFSTGGITSNSTATCFPSREPFPSRESISFHWSPSQNATRTHFGANQNEIRIKQVAPWQNFYIKFSRRMVSSRAVGCNFVDSPFRQQTIIIIFTCLRKHIPVGSRLGMGLAVPCRLSHGQVTLNPFGPLVKLLSRLAQPLCGPRSSYLRQIYHRHSLSEQSPQEEKGSRWPTAWSPNSQ